MALLYKIKMRKLILLICTILFLATPSSVNTHQIVPVYADFLDRSLKKIMSLLVL
jgi:hypothetical protein